MKKVIFTLLIVFIVITGVIVGYMITTNNNRVSMEDEVNKVGVLGAVEDECTEEYDDNEIVASSAEEKVSPNAKLIIEKFHSRCENTTIEEMPIPYDMVNLTKEEVEAKYAGWIARKFSSAEVILYGVFDTKCPEHYVLKEVDNKIAIFTENDDGNLTFYKSTEISTEYLPEEDLIPLRTGIKVHGKVALNETLENFE